MPKRLSKERRAALKARQAVIQRAKATDDSHMLQQGAVRCALARNALNFKGMKPPRQSEGHSVEMDRTKRARANPQRTWGWDYTKVPGYKPFEA